MKQIIFLIIFCCSCTFTPSTKKKISPTIATGQFSCYGGICCWPYLHHKDVKGYNIMICTDQCSDIMGIVPNRNYDSFRVSLKTYFLNP